MVHSKRFLPCRSSFSFFCFGYVLIFFCSSLRTGNFFVSLFFTCMRFFQCVVPRMVEVASEKKQLEALFLVLEPTLASVAACLRAPPPIFLPRCRSLLLSTVLGAGTAEVRERRRRRLSTWRTLQRQFHERLWSARSG
jgi:hypothetical protein